MLKEAKAEMLKLKEKNLKNVFFFFPQSKITLQSKSPLPKTLI